jgi:hypothetical protein
MLSRDGSPRLSRSWRRKRDQPSNKLTTIYEDGMVDFDSRNRQRWALLALLSMMVLCGMEGTDFRALNSKKGRRQDTPSGSNQTSWEYEADSSRPGKRRSIFRRPIGISLKAIARLEDLPGDEDISNEFETISPIRLHHIPKPSKNAVTTINLDEQAVSTEQHHDVLSAIHSVLPPQESKKPLESHWGAYQSFYKDPTWLELMPTGSEPLIPTFWHIPKTGGSTIKAILGNCHFKRMASEVGVLHGHGKDGKIEVVHIPDQIEHTLHVNVDVTTFSGLQRAASLGLVSSGAVEVIATPLLWGKSVLHMYVWNLTLVAEFVLPCSSFDPLIYSSQSRRCPSFSVHQYTRQGIFHVSRSNIQSCLYVCLFTRGDTRAYLPSPLCKLDIGGLRNIKSSGGQFYDSTACKYSPQGAVGQGRLGKSQGRCLPKDLGGIARSTRRIIGTL